MYCIQCWLNLVLDLLVAAVGVVVIVLAVLLPQMTSPGTIGVALNNVLGFNQALAALIDSWTQLETSLGAIARVKNLELDPVMPHKPSELFLAFATFLCNMLDNFRTLTGNDHIRYAYSQPGFEGRIAED